MITEASWISKQHNEHEPARSRILEPLPVCLHHHLSLPLPTTHDGAGMVLSLLEMARIQDEGRRIQQGFQVLGEDLRAQFCRGGGYWNPHGISVWNKLGRVCQS